jgi:hypothetical protein
MGSLGNADDCASNIFGRKHIVDEARVYRAFRHIWMRGGFRFLRDGDAARLFDTAQGRRPIAIIAGNNDGDNLTVPVFRNLRTCDTNSNRNSEISHRRDSAMTGRSAFTFSVGAAHSP